MSLVFRIVADIVAPPAAPAGFGLIGIFFGTILAIILGLYFLLKLINKAKERKLITINLFVFSTTHALVDASCAAVVLSRLSENMDIQYFMFLVVLYNVLAFGLQPLLGIFADRTKRIKEVSIAGCLFVALSAFIAKDSLLTVYLADLVNVSLLEVCFAGLGNALFHVGGGIVSLKLKPGKAAFPGVYVAPGALGLLIGTLYAKSGQFQGWPFVTLLILASAAILLIKTYEAGYEYKTSCIDKRELTILLILFSIAIRGLVGFMLNYPWKSDTRLLIIFTVAVVLGKAFGGILADKFGWTRVTGSGLAISAILLSLGYSTAFIAILGVFFFNLTMPITLVAVSNLLPNREGFSFGLTTLALLIGAFPTFTKLKTVICYDNKWLILASVFIMTFVLYKGLKGYESSDTINF